jgi:propanol-preferring alcohol dehydrogenase
VYEYIPTSEGIYILSSVIFIPRGFTYFVLIVMSAVNAQLPTRMHAWRKHRADTDPHYEELPVPETPKDGFLIKVLAAGVCHTDLTLLNLPDQFWPPYAKDDFILGHEGCGEIVDIGPDIPSSSEAKALKVGDRVAINPVPGCGLASCVDCGNNLPQLCANPDSLHHGLGQDGSLADYVAISHRSAVKVPDRVSSAAVAVSPDAIATAYHAAVRQVGITGEDTVFIFGLGGLGFNAFQILKDIGCNIYVSDTREGPMNEAVRLGLPKENYVPLGTAVPRWVNDNGLENKIDVVLDFAGAQQTFSDAEVIVRRGGKILNVGIHDLAHQTNHVGNIMKSISIYYAYGTHSSSIAEVMEKIAQRVITPKTEAAPMKDFPKVLKDLHEGRIQGRMVLVPEGVKEV